jgi:hypothetical protein
MMEAARTSETSVDNYFTRQYIPEDNFELHTRRSENFKSHISIDIRSLFKKSMLVVLDGTFGAYFSDLIWACFLI